MKMNWNKYYKEQLLLGIVTIIFFIAFLYGWYIYELIPVTLFGILTIVCLYAWAYRMYSPAYDEDKNITKR